jgi:hypothetical protein
MTLYPAKLPPRAALLRLSGRDYDVLVAIARHANRDGYAYPSLATIAKEAGTLEKRVPSRIRKLEQKRLLCVVRSGGGRHRCNVYRIVHDDDLSATAPPDETTDYRSTAMVAPQSGPRADGKSANQNTPESELETPHSRSRNTPISESEGLHFSGQNPPPAEDQTEAGTYQGPPQGTEGRARARATPPPRSNHGCDIRNYQPGPDIVTWAAEYRPDLDPLDRGILEAFRNYCAGRGIRVLDPDALYKHWLSRERSTSSGQPDRSNTSARRWAENRNALDDLVRRAGRE